ncbi:MAG: outer membrane beta-barrel protein [Sinimarinibacterium flocculans]|uniref:outer membrane beta-barrel protein n=1 Tax=Sinimarinibacterium flocculans TaxID=985250 RepID=UPI003C6969E7
MNTAIPATRTEGGLTHYAAGLGVLLAAAFCVPAAQAQTNPDGGFYLGGGIGYNRVESRDFPNDDDELEDDHVGYKGIIGVRVSDVFSIEGQYIDFGTSEDGNNEVEADGWTAGVLVALPIFEVVKPYAKAGALFWDADGRTGLGTQLTSGSDDGTDFTYGVGLRFDFTEAVALRTEYERFALDEIDVDLASANLAFSF